MMKDTTELRIGNYVTRNDPKLIYITCKDEEERIDVDIIDGIPYKTKVSLFNDGNYNSASYFMDVEIGTVLPIPITEEWLLKFGFKEYSLTPDCYFTDIFDSIYKTNEGFFYSNYEPSGKIKIDFVHQLQNLYFALTGKELIL